MKQWIGKTDGKSFAVKIEGVDPEFPKLPFGRQLGENKKVQAFKAKAKKCYVGAKGEATLSAVRAWIKERQPKLKYNRKKIDGQQLHELTYNPKSRRGILGLRIRLYFHFETFRHVMTEYRYNSSYLYEQFDEFREVDGLVLPHKYTIYYSTHSSFDGESVSRRWILKAEHWLHNSRIELQPFKAE